MAEPFSDAAILNKKQNEEDPECGIGSEELKKKEFHDDFALMGQAKVKAAVKLHGKKLHMDKTKKDRALDAISGAYKEENEPQYSRGEEAFPMRKPNEVMSEAASNVDLAFNTGISLTTWLEQQIAVEKMKRNQAFDPDLPEARERFTEEIQHSGAATEDTTNETGDAKYPEKFLFILVPFFVIAISVFLYFLLNEVYYYVFP